ncbi:MAG: hypothetical protein U0S12_06715 [Fimbriimonadales bacterium]
MRSSSNGRLYLFIAGNLQTNGNKVWIFFDYKPGGQNRLRGDNPSLIVNMGDSGGANGNQFDWALTPTRPSRSTALVGPASLWTSTALTGGGGTTYLGHGHFSQCNGALTGGTNPYGVKYAQQQ